jgi:hypothetical protein
MLLSEILNRKIDYKITNATRRDFNTEAIIGNRKIMFDADSDNGLSWEVSFLEKDLKSTSSRSYDVTGSGNELEVFSMVKDSILELIKKYDPNEISFNASKKEGNATRANLYDRLIKRFKIPGYSYRRDETSANAYFVLRKDGVEFEYD